MPVSINEHANEHVNEHVDEHVNEHVQMNMFESVFISGHPRYRVGLMAKRYGRSLKQWKFKYFKYAQWAYLNPFKTSSLRESQPQTFP